jgi:hypothetical protein
MDKEVVDWVHWCLIVCLGVVLFLLLSFVLLGIVLIPLFCL